MERIEILEPKLTVPFASFVYFCNQENKRMNDWINTPEKISRMNLKGVHFMYPADKWDSTVNEFNSSEAIDKYMKDYKQRILGVGLIDPTPESVDKLKLSKAIDGCMAKLRGKFSKRALRKIELIDIYLHDLNKIVLVQPVEGTHKIIDATPDLIPKSRFVMCSQVAWYLFAFNWGGGTLQVSGMYLDRFYSTRGHHSFFLYQNLLCTEVLEFGNAKKAWQTCKFFWKKSGNSRIDF